MNPNPLKTYFEARQIALTKLSEAVIHSHSGIAGSAREVLIRELLLAHLPAALRVGTGLVFGHEWARSGDKEKISSQQDIVIYRNDFPVLEVGGQPLFFRESVVATIEVKTDLHSTNLEALVINASSVVGRVTPVPVATYQMLGDGPRLRTTPRRVLTGVFAFRGGDVRSTLVRRLNSLLATLAQRTGATAGDIIAPDFFYSPEAGLVVRQGEFNVLEQSSIAGLDSVYGGLMEEEKELGAYRRAFGGEHKWRGLQTIILELTERCQRYAASYASLSGYV